MIAVPLLLMMPLEPEMAGNEDNALFVTNFFFGTKILFFVKFTF